MTEIAICPSCEREFERGPDACPNCSYEFGGDPADEDRPARYRADRLERESKQRLGSMPQADGRYAGVFDGGPGYPGNIYLGSGAVIALAGCLAEWLAYSSDISGYGDYINFSKLAERQIAFELGLGLWIIAAIFVATGSVLNLLDLLRRQLPSNDADNGGKQADRG